MRGFLLVFAVSACATNDGTTNVAQSAMDAWVNDAYPALKAADCFVCHSHPNPAIPQGDFLAGDNPAQARATLLASLAVDLTQPTNSRILTKGFHAGPPLTAEQSAAILSWLATE